MTSVWPEVWRFGPGALVLAAILTTARVVADPGAEPRRITVGSLPQTAGEREASVPDLSQVQALLARSASWNAEPKDAREHGPELLSSRLATLRDVIGRDRGEAARQALEAATALDLATTAILQRYQDIATERPDMAEVLRVRGEALQERSTSLKAILAEVEEDAARSEAWASLRARLLSLVGMDASSRLGRLDAVLRLTGKARQARPLGLALNPDLAYEAWSQARTSPLLGQVVPAYASNEGAATLEDLASTSETVLTPEVQDEATRLKSVVNVVAFVNREIRLEWYFGAMKSAGETLREREGNDADSASLTIALLRGIGVPARYVYGSIELTREQLIDVLGLPPGSDEGMVLRALEGAGIPHEPVVKGGRLWGCVLAHVWVEAFVPYGDYRGAGRGTGMRQWVPIDPQIDAAPRYRVHAPEVDVAAALGDGSAVVADYLLGTGTASPLDAIRSRVASVVGNSSLDEARWSRELIAGGPELLPGTLPYKVVAVNGEYALLPESLQHTVEFRVERQGQVVLSAKVPAGRLAGLRTAVVYVPASEEDESALTAAGSAWGDLASSVQMTPELRIEGVAISIGSAPAFLGEHDTLRIVVKTPEGITRSIEDDLVVGNAVAIGVGGPRNGYVPGPLFLESDRDGTATRLDYDRVAEYANSWSDAESEIASYLGVRVLHPTVNVTISGSLLAVEELLGIPVRVRWHGLFVDADLRTVVGISPNRERSDALLRLSGLVGSHLEGRVLEAQTEVEAVTTLRALREAAAQAIPILDLGPGTPVPRELDAPASVVADVIDQVSRGRRVLIPAHRLRINEWTGTGYVVMAPEAEGVSYQLTDGLSGAVLSTVEYDTSPFWATAYFHPAFTEPCITAAQLSTIYDPNAPPTPLITTLVKVKDTSNIYPKSGDNVTVAGQVSTSMQVLAIAQWRSHSGPQCAAGATCPAQNPDGNPQWGQRRALWHKACVSGATVVFDSLGAVRSALSTDPATLQTIATLKDPAQVVAGVLAATSTATQLTNEQGRATVHALTDPRIARDVNGLLLKPIGSETESVLAGSAMVMAKVLGVEARYELLLERPFMLVVTPATPAKVVPVGPSEIEGVPGLQLPPVYGTYVQDRFGNVVSNVEVTWSSSDFGAAFVDASQLQAGQNVGKPFQRDPAALDQLPVLKQTTGPIYPAMAYYIPGWADPDLGGSVYTTFEASSVGGSTAFAAIVNRGEPYSFAVTYNDSGYPVGIRTTRLPRPVSLGILERAAKSWVPVSGADPRFTDATVFLQTTTSAGPTMESFDLRRLGAESGGYVNVWPLLVGRDEDQEMVFSARLADGGGERCCDTQFYLNARSDLVHLSASRFDAVWTPGDVTASSPPRVTDRRLIVKADYQASRPVTMLLYPPVANIQSVELSTGSSSRSAVLNFPPTVTVVGDLGFPVETGEHEIVLQVQDRDEVGNALTRELDPRQAIETTLPRNAQGDPTLNYMGAWQCRYALWGGTDFQGHHYSGGLHCAVPASSDRLDIDVPDIMSGTPNTPDWAGLPRAGCDNNPCAQCLQERSIGGHEEGGPIPAGLYKISAGYVDLERPYVTYRVEPVPPNDACGRSGILIHFGIPDRVAWSTGCIVTARTDLKDQLARYGGGTLDVVNGDGFDVARCPDPQHLGQGYTGGAFCSGLQPSAAH